MNKELIVIFNLFLAGVLGGLIGIEREIKGKPAGIRTNILIALGSALFIQTVFFLSDSSSDVARVLGQVITGIGFLGAGSIIQSTEGVRGLTSAATIWITAGIGIAVGVGAYICAISATIMVLLVLGALSFLEKKIQVFVKQKE